MDAPQVGTEIEDWHDFVDQVRYHSNHINEGNELRVHKKDDLCRVYCSEKELGCKYSFSAQFLVLNLQEGAVEVKKVSTTYAAGFPYRTNGQCRLLTSTVWDAGITISEL